MTMPNLQKIWKQVFCKYCNLKKTFERLKGPKSSKAKTVPTKKSCEMFMFLGDPGIQNGEKISLNNLAMTSFIDSIKFGGFFLPISICMRCTTPALYMLGNMLLPIQY